MLADKLTYFVHVVIAVLYPKQCISNGLIDVDVAVDTFAQVNIAF